MATTDIMEQAPTLILNMLKRNLSDGLRAKLMETAAAEVDAVVRQALSELQEEVKTFYDNSRMLFVADVIVHTRHDKGQ